MASRAVERAAMCLVGITSVALLAVPAASAFERTPAVVDRQGAVEHMDARGERGESGRRASACGRQGASWTHVPADARRGVPAVAAVASGAQATLTVVVPRTAVVHVDTRGRVMAAWTNTGCPPRSGDEMWVRRPDGSLTRTTDARYLRREWVGEFDQAGVIEVQQPEG